MSNLERLENLKQIVKIVQPEFEVLAQFHKAVHYRRETSFALQILNDNSYLCQVALGDQDSFKRAIINVAAIGLSLSPVLKLAYLVPRDKKVCLDVSSRGYIQLATEVGAIRWAIAEIVCEKDEYTYQGIGREPLHRFNPFQDRGKVVGCYCLAKTHADEFILTQMPASEVFSIRDRSPSWRAYQKDSAKLTPWKTDEGEMIKKTIIKRAAKSWPLTDTRERLEKAIDISNESDPIEIGPAINMEDETRLKGLAAIRAHLVTLGRTEQEFIEHLIRTNRRDLKKLEDLTPQEVSKANVFLIQTVEQRKPKELLNEKAG